jgi:hypothetical protein
LKEPLITWDGCRVLDTRSHDDHWTKCRHPETAHNTVSSYDCTVRWSGACLSKPENVRAAPYAQISARQCAGLQIRPHSTLGRERFFTVWYGIHVTGERTNAIRQFRHDRPHQRLKRLDRRSWHWSLCRLRFATFYSYCAQRAAEKNTPLYHVGSPQRGSFCGFGPDSATLAVKTLNPAAARVVVRRWQRPWRSGRVPPRPQHLANDPLGCGRHRYHTPEQHIARQRA